MFRLLGILIGSATSIGIILLVTGIPEFHLENPELDQKRFDEAVEKLMARKLEPEPVTVAAPDPAMQLTTAATENSVDPINPPLPVVDEMAEPIVEAMDASQEMPAYDAPAVAEFQPSASQWYSFWNPFRSELAANGFVSQLEKVTGLDYRVVRVKTGVYEVAFAYFDDTERKLKLSQISAATGLDLPDS